MVLSQLHQLMERRQKLGSVRLVTLSAATRKSRFRVWVCQSRERVVIAPCNEPSTHSNGVNEANGASRGARRVADAANKFFVQSVSVTWRQRDQYLIQRVTMLSDTQTKFAPDDSRRMLFE